MTGAPWRWDDVDGIAILRCDALDAIPGLSHAFSSRLAFGAADFDLGPAENESQAVRERREAFMRVAGFGRARPAILRQVHGALIVSGRETASGLKDADGVFRDASDGDAPIPAVRSADCVGLLVAHRSGDACAALHGGWRGLAAGIAAEGVARFESAGYAAADLVVALGPAILDCCYEVGPEVIARLESSCGPAAPFVGRSRADRTTVSLHAAAAAQLSAAGVPKSAIHAAPLCTRCRTDRFFSFRGEGEGCGRLMAAVGPAPRP